MSNKQLLLEFEKKIIFMKDVMDGKYNTINKNKTERLIVFFVILF